MLYCFCQIAAVTATTIFNWSAFFYLSMQSAFYIPDVVMYSLSIIVKNTFHYKYIVIQPKAKCLVAT